MRVRNAHGEPAHLIIALALDMCNVQGVKSFLSSVSNNG